MLLEQEANVAYASILGQVALRRRLGTMNWYS